MDNKPKKPLVRRDGTGHLDPKYAADLRKIGRETAPPHSDDTAFFDEPRSGDPLAEHLGESFVQQATSGEDCTEDVADEVVPEESGGPFVESGGNREFAYDEDESNPRDAHREPFPRT
jgi:hypothetical protein